MAIFRGKVVSGMGNFSYWIEKLDQHYFRKTGMKLFPGTLNVQLDKPYTLPKKIIRLEGSECGGSVSVNIVPCAILGKSAFILRTAEFFSFYRPMISGKTFMQCGVKEFASRKTLVRRATAPLQYLKIFMAIFGILYN